MPQPALQVKFQASQYVPPTGWAVDDGSSFGPRTNIYPSPAGYTQYGWNCNPAADTRSNNALGNYHNTFLRMDQGSCSNCNNPSWSVNVPNGNYHVETLYSMPWQSMRGCTIALAPDYSTNHKSLQSNDMEWFATDVNTTTGQLTFSGGNGCPAVTAIAIWPETAIPTTTYCQTLPGMCCPLLIDMANRPCTQFDPPCAL